MCIQILGLSSADIWTNIIGLVVSSLALFISMSALNISKKSLEHEVFVKLLEEYKSNKMQNALVSLYDNYRRNKNFIDDYREGINGNGKVSSVEFHNERGIVTNFYQKLAALKKNKIIDKKFIYANWDCHDLEIIVDIIIPMEQILFFKLKRGKFNNDIECETEFNKATASMQRLYDDAIPKKWYIGF